MPVMKRTLNIEEEAEASEMAIVDTFTKLIFGDESPYSDSELRIIAALREVDTHAAFGCHGNLGAYLRALGVEEMIALVSVVRSGMGRMNCSNLRAAPSHGGLSPSTLGQAH